MLLKEKKYITRNINDTIMTLINTNKINTGSLIVTNAPYPRKIPKDIRLALNMWTLGIVCSETILRILLNLFSFTSASCTANEIFCKS